MDKLTHFDAAGQAWMVDVAGKDVTLRYARAGGRIEMAPATLAVIAAGSARKGDVLGVARIAAIQAAKKASELVPLCHPLALTRVAVEFALVEAVQGAVQGAVKEAVEAAVKGPAAVACTVEVETRGRTGVEIEALAAVQVGLLTVYDMCKSIDRGMRIEAVRLLEKRGGASGTWIAAD